MLKGDKLFGVDAHSLVVEVGQGSGVFAGNGWNIEGFWGCFCKRLGKGDGTGLGEEGDAVFEGDLAALGADDGGAGQFPIDGDDAGAGQEVGVEEGGIVVRGGQDDG